MPTPKIFTLFKNVNIPANGNAFGPGSALDLSEYTNFRLVIRFDGPAGTKFTINELYGPAGAIDQLNSDIDTGTIDSLGSLNYRKKFDIFGPKHFSIRVFNNGAGPIKVNGSLYAV